MYEYHSTGVNGETSEVLKQKYFNIFCLNFRSVLCRDLKHPESSGYAFLNTKLFFSSLVDFVRYYSHCSMKEHNAQLDTKLKIPAFKGTL